MRIYVGFDFFFSYLCRCLLCFLYSDCLLSRAQFSNGLFMPQIIEMANISEDDQLICKVSNANCVVFLCV